MRNGVTHHHHYMADSAIGWMVRGSNPYRGKGFFSSPKHPDWLWGPPSLLFNGYWGFLWVVKQPSWLGQGKLLLFLLYCWQTQHILWLVCKEDKKTCWSCFSILLTGTLLSCCPGKDSHEILATFAAHHDQKYKAHKQHDIHWVRTYAVILETLLN